MGSLMTRRNYKELTEIHLQRGPGGSFLTEPVLWDEGTGDLFIRSARCFLDGRKLVRKSDHPWKLISRELPRSTSRPTCPVMPSTRAYDPTCQIVHASSGRSTNPRRQRGLSIERTPG